MRAEKEQGEASEALRATGKTRAFSLSGKGLWRVLSREGKCLDLGAHRRPLVAMGEQTVRRGQWVGMGWGGVGQLRDQDTGEQ